MKTYFLLIALLSLQASSAVAADDSATLPTAEEVVSRMAAHDLQRQASIEGYAGMRRYILENQKLNKRAEMLVKVRGEQNGTKHFEIVSEEGWKAAHKHVLRKMLESESETSRPDKRAESKLNFENYDFALTGTELVGERRAYVLEVSPKRKERYLFRGRIWVDAEDYALMRAEGSPAKNPSFWTKSTHFVQVYRKNGALWFPLSTQSITEVRFFGDTDVSIDYFDYAPQSLTTSGMTLLSSEGSHKP